MPLTTSNRAVSSHLFLFRDGGAFTVPSAGTAGREAKPGAADTGWIEWGYVKNLSVEKAGDVSEIFKGAPGRRVRHNVLRYNQAIDLSFQLEDLRAECFEMAFGTGALTAASTQFNPLEGAEKKFWLKLQQYDQTNTLINTVDVYIDLDIDGALEFGDGVVTASFKAMGLHSTLNTGTL